MLELYLGMLDIIYSEQDQYLTKILQVKDFGVFFCYLEKMLEKC